MIIPSKFNGYTKDGIRRLYMGGGGGPTQTTSTVQNTNVPEYARPYVESMLGATQEQLFQGSRGPSTTNPTTGEVTQGDFNITGFKPYQAYGGTYDPKTGEQTSYDPSKAIAGFSPMQQQSQQTIAGMQVPGQYQTAADITGAGIMGAADVGAQARAFNPMAQQAAGMGQQYQRMATDPNAISAYMSPYMQNVVDVQNREAVRNSQIAGTQQQGQATQAGAFGGGRDAIMRAERERNLSTTMNQNQAQGSQNAFQQAQQAQQYGANLGLQGIQTGASIYGQGLSAQQQAIQQALGGAGQLAGLGTQALEAQKGIAGLQGQVGAQQQGLEQQKINQAMQDYANAQQYPLMQLGTMSNMLRGLPMQASSTQQYQAAPNQLSQAIGTIGSGASLYNAMKAEGGVIKGYYGGGIMSYDVGGEVESDLESMPSEALAREAKESPSPIIRQKAQRILRERQMEQAPQGMAGGGIIAFQSGGTEAEKLAEQNRMYILGAQANAEARRQEALDADKTGDVVPLNISSAPRPGLKEGLMSVGRRISEAIARPPLPSMQLDSDSAGLEAVPASAPAADAAAAPAPAPAAAPPAAAPAVAAPAAPRAAAPAGIKSAPGAAAVGEVGSTAPKVATGAQAAAEAAQTIADRPDSAFLADVEAQKATLGPNVGQDEYRKQVMSERVNAADEAKRLKNMRLVEFFSTWGSTPGPTLVAGMEALKKSIPSFITDEKDQKKARQESDKLIYTLDEATRQEKLGNIKEATARKEKAAERAMHLQQFLTTQQTSAASDASRERASKFTAEMHLKAANVRAKSDSAYRTADQSNRAEDRIFGRYQAASKEYDHVVESVARAESQDAHKNDLKNLDKYTMGAKDKKTGEINPEKINKEFKVPYAETLARVNKRKEGWNTAVEDARAEKNLAFSRVKGLSPEAVAARTGNKDAPTAAPSTGSVSGEFGAPTAAHINALKANPTQKAAFDAKFGPGAADEYLRK